MEQRQEKTLDVCTPLEGRDSTALLEATPRNGRRGPKFSIDKSDTHGNILWYENYSYHKLSSLGIKVPDREPWETKIVQRRETLNGNEEESRQEKETLSERMLVSEIPQGLPREAPPGGLFRFRYALLAVRYSPFALPPPPESRELMCEKRTANSASTKSSCPSPTNRARNAGTGL